MSCSAGSTFRASRPTSATTSTSCARRADGTTMMQPLLEVKELKTLFRSDQGVVHAVNGVSFAVPAGSVLGIVGESGCGKSVTALSIMRLIEPPGRIAGGQVLLYEKHAARDLLALAPQEMEHIRGNVISMIFQDPLTSLNPVLSIGYQITEPLKRHMKLGGNEACKRAIELL